MMTVNALRYSQTVQRLLADAPEADISKFLKTSGNPLKQAWYGFTGAYQRAFQKMSDTQHNLAFGYDNLLKNRNAWRNAHWASGPGGFVAGVVGTAALRGVVGNSSEIDRLKREIDRLQNENDRLRKN